MPRKRYNRADCSARNRKVRQLLNKEYKLKMRCEAEEYDTARVCTRYKKTKAERVRLQKTREKVCRK